MISAAGQIRALQALGVGIGLWIGGLFLLMLGGPAAVAWLFLMIAAAVAGVVTMVRTTKNGRWPVAILFPLGFLLTVVSGLGVLAPLAM